MLGFVWRSETSNHTVIKVMKAFLTRSDQACTSPLTTHCQSRAPPAADELNVKKKKEGLKTFQ